jgi:cytochrome b6-f complex iron-sulfur subunit
MSHQPPAYGEVPGPPIGEITRRTFMRRMIGVGIGILTLEFFGGTWAFLWPNVTAGLGGLIPIGNAAAINALAPKWAAGEPYLYGPANLFIVNIPAAEALVEGKNTPVPDPKDKVLALYRKCPHLGCQIPQLCDKSHWFECLCHGSKYTVLGEKRDGPAPRGMDRFKTEIDKDGNYVIDTRQKITGPPVGTVTFDPRQKDQMQHCTGL